MLLLCGVTPAQARPGPAPGQLPVPIPTPVIPVPVPLPGAGGPSGAPTPAAGGDSGTPAPSPTPAPVPTNAAGARALLDQVQREAEALTEQWHAAQDDVAARKADVAKLETAVGPAQDALAKAQADEAAYRVQSDAVAMATFESGNLDQLDALLAAESPQDFLDQMSALETITSQYRDVLLTLVQKVDQTRDARAAAAAAVARARAAVDQAAAAERDLTARKRDAEIRIAEADRLLRQLSPAERRARNDTAVAVPDIVGSGVGVDALRAAATQLGKPYRWGATGPGSYDCSGLTSWAFRQAGVTLPRSSSQQATVGRTVAWNDLQPGDLVFLYNPISHVGIYAGDGVYIDAPQTGDVVKFQKVPAAQFATARRI